MDESGGEKVIVQQGYKQIADEFNLGAHGRRAGFTFRQNLRAANDIASNRRRDLKKRFPEFLSSQDE